MTDFSQIRKINWVRKREGGGGAVCTVAQIEQNIFEMFRKYQYFIISLKSFRNIPISFRFCSSINLHLNISGMWNGRIFSTAQKYTLRISIVINNILLKKNLLLSVPTQHSIFLKYFSNIFNLSNISKHFCNVREKIFYNILLKYFNETFSKFFRNF